MFRNAASLLGLLGLAISPPCFGQTGSSETNSGRTNSSQLKDRRLAQDELDISLLKRLVREQGTRITELERTVRSLRTATPAHTDEPAVHEPVKVIVKPFAAQWQNPLAWTQIREGLSRAQVEEILGKPTSVESVIDYQTLLYKGDVPGTGTINGMVKLTDDRVSEIRPPNF